MVAEPTATREELEQLRKRKRLQDLERKRITARSQLDGLTPQFDRPVDPAKLSGALQGDPIDRFVASFENFNPQPDAGIKSPLDAFLFKGVNAISGGGLQRAGNEAYEGTVQEGFGDRAVRAADSMPVGATAGQITGMAAQLQPFQRAASVAKNAPGIKQVVDAAGKTRAGSYLGRLMAGSAAWTGESAMQGATTLADEASAYTGELPTLGDRASTAKQMATMNLGDLGVKLPVLKDAPINVLGPVGTSLARRGGTAIATQGASVTPQNVRESVQSATGRISGGPEQMRAVAEIIDAELAGGLRPQAIAAVNRLLKGSGLTTDDVMSLNREVRNRLDASSGSAVGRKTVGQHYSEILDDPDGPLYKPQASLNITAALRERRMNTTPGDGSAGVIGSTLRGIRDTQKGFLEESANKNLGSNTRRGVKEQVKAVQKDIASEYERILEAAPRMGASADTLRSLVKADPSKSSVLRRRAKNAGLSVDGYIDQNPYAAAHWMRSRLSRDARSASGREKGDLLDTVEQLDEVLDGFDVYQTTKRNWGTEQGVLNAQQFGDKLFGGSNSSLMNNPGLRQQLVEEFKSLPAREQEVALVSIRDAALGKMQGGPAGQSARLTAITSDAAIDFFEGVGAKPFADDLLAIKNEQGFHNSYDPDYNSRTAPNQRAVSQAPDLYGSTLSNAVRADGQGMGVIPIELAASQFAPGLSGWYAAYRGMKATANKAFDLRNSTKEDMTRFLMSRAGAPKSSAVNADLPMKNITPQAPPSGAPGTGAVAANLPQKRVARAGAPMPGDPPVANGFFGRKKMEFPDNPDAVRGTHGQPVNTGLALGGARAKTADLDALKQAEALEQQGLSPEDVFAQTGWYRGYDKKKNWRFEISDASARLKMDDLPQGTYRIEDVLDFEELYKAYPDLRNMKIKVKKPKRFAPSASYNAITDGVKTHGSPQMSDLIHEVGGHGAQQRERFGLYARDYTPSSHEVEARALEARARLSPEERSAIPSQHYDVKIENIIPSKEMSTPERIAFSAVRRLLQSPTVQGGAVGAGVGAAAPADSNEERLRNMAIGGAMGATAGRFDRGGAARNAPPRGVKIKDGGSTYRMQPTRGAQASVRFSEPPQNPQHIVQEVTDVDMGLTQGVSIPARSVHEAFVNAQQSLMHHAKTHQRPVYHFKGVSNGHDRLYARMMQSGELPEGYSGLIARGAPDGTHYFLVRSERLAEARQMAASMGEVEVVSAPPPVITNGIGGSKEAMLKLAKNNFPAVKSDKMPPGGLPQKRTAPQPEYAATGDGGGGLGLLLGTGAVGAGAAVYGQMNQSDASNVAPGDLPALRQKLVDDYAKALTLSNPREGLVQHHESKVRLMDDLMRRESTDRPQGPPEVERARQEIIGNILTKIEHAPQTDLAPYYERLDQIDALISSGSAPAAPPLGVPSAPSLKPALPQR